ncbi:MAG: hypothetical protein Q9165_007261 [Trypethelium subeluteriae]
MANAVPSTEAHCGECSDVSTHQTALKVAILLLEAKRKSKWVSWNEKEHSPEETSGIFSLGVFFWLNKMFFEGYKKVLRIKDLYPLDSNMKSELLHEKFSRNMDYSKLKGDKFGLVKVLARTLKGPLLLPIPPRLALLGFTFCQPFFIETLLNHLSKPEVDANVGYFHHRMRSMARSILVTEIFSKATKARIGTGDDTAVLTLMSTDVERIKLGFMSLHDIWAGIIQVALAAWMLYNQLGVVFVAPIATVIVCSLSLVIFMRFTGDSQRAWMAGIQKRVGLTARVIASMKNLKISGLSTAVSDFVQRLRVEELAAGSRFRKIQIVAALIGYVPLLISPPLTFAFAQRSLNVTRIFTSLSYLLLLTNPLAQIFETVPTILSGVTCLGRIQTFLECETRHDFRKVLGDIRRNPEKTCTAVPASSDSELGSADAIVIRNGKFGWESDKFALQNMDTRIAKSSLTLVIGPVGSGKSTLCKALLGEIPFSEGSMVSSTRFPHVGFCDQTTFLSNGTIRDNIVGFSPFNSDRYAEVMNATALGFDFETLPHGDRTNIGSDGITLSGGQRQRVSLARALYLQSDLLVLDDVFSGLDADTEEQVFRQVFGSDGLLRRRQSTVVLCTHSTRHLPAADYIIALGDGTVVEQGSFNDLMNAQGYVQRLGLTGFSDNDTSPEKTTSKNIVQGRKQQLRHTTTPKMSSLTRDADKSRQLGDKTVYGYYLKSMGSFLAVCIFLCAALWGFFMNFPTICEFVLVLNGFLPDEVRKNARLLNSSQRPAYLLVMIQQWLNLVLNIVVMIMAVVLTALAVRLKSNSGFTGASLVTLMNFGDNLSGIVIYYTKLETSIGAIARLKTFSENVKPEDRDEENIVPSEQWPRNGVIELKGVSASYDAEQQSDGTPNLALRDINLTINSGEKVAICGRTGSGKSSLIALLLKLLEPLPETAGNVAIDDLLLHRIDRTALRHRIVAVPQEAVFLPDGFTFQANLDPFDVSTPDECQAILEAVGLWQFVQQRGGLGAGTSAEKLSAGQRQLMSLGRALLRRRVRARKPGMASGGLEGGILLLDEVSSSVDHETERAMQEVIRTEFRDYTVVAVSHRLDMISDFDRVVVMDMGEIVEIGNPIALAETEGTRFGELVKAGAK